LPDIPGLCTLVNSTKTSLTFTWQSTSASRGTRYRLFGHGVNKTIYGNRITVDGLTPGSHYAFSVWAEECFNYDICIPGSIILCSSSTSRTYILSPQMTNSTSCYSKCRMTATHLVGLPTLLNVILKTFDGMFCLKLATIVEHRLPTPQFTFMV